MAYSVVLLVHSYLRWLVLLAGLVVLVRSWRGWLGKKPFVDGDARAQIAFLAVLDTQLLLGLLLYFVLSPVTMAFLAAPKPGMKDTIVRFFGVEHLTAMLVAVVVAHVGRAVSKRRTDAVARHKLVAITTLVWLVLVVVSIPWPGMTYGRPLFR